MSYPYTAHRHGDVYPIPLATVEVVFKFQSCRYTPSGVCSAIEVIGTCTNDDTTYKML